MHNLQDQVCGIAYLTLLCILRCPLSGWLDFWAVQDIALEILKITVILKWLKQFCPLTNSTKILRPRTCVTSQAAWALHGMRGEEGVAVVWRVQARPERRWADNTRRIEEWEFLRLLDFYLFFPPFLLTQFPRLGQVGFGASGIAPEGAWLGLT